MSKAEEKALEVYKKDSCNEDTQNKIEGFINGYNQAQQALMEKAKQWFTDNIPSQKLQLLWCEFEQFITE